MENQAMPLTPREKFIMALEGKQPPGRVPHFELRFYLTMEVFGKVHPEHRNYHQWGQMTETERELHRCDMADVLIQSAERFEHSAIFLSGAVSSEEFRRQAQIIREKTGEKFFLMKHGDATFSVPGGDSMLEFACRLGDDPEGVKREAAERVDNAIRDAETYFADGPLDGMALCADYCFNTGPFLSPRQFSEFVAPYLEKLIKAYRDMGLYTIKHTDGNIMPIIDQLIQCRPHALHSLDPQGGVDIADVKRRYGKQVCLVGNVNCGLLDTGTEAECAESARYALRHGMPGGGYVFSTSNCIYTGMRLARYELMLDVWRQWGAYA